MLYNLRTDLISGEIQRSESLCGIWNVIDELTSKRLTVFFFNAFAR